MADLNATQPSLLIRIRDLHDRHAWSQFVDLYAPLIHGFGRKHGLQDADAADLTQEVFRAVARAIPDWHYDTRRGSFRAWLFTIVRNKLRDWLEAQGRLTPGTGDTAAHRHLQALPGPLPDESAEWESEHQKRKLEWAADQVRGEVQDSTWQSFWRTAVLGQSGKEVAADLGISVAAVYLAKSRVMARIKEQVQALEEDE